MTKPDEPSHESFDKFLFTGFFDLSVVSSFFVHIPKPETLKPDSYISSSDNTHHSQHQLPHFALFVETHLQHGTGY